MAGLLSFLFGQPQGLLAQNGGMNQLPQPEPYDPRQGRMAGLSQGLLGLGAGIAGGGNWGQGLSMGLLGANQGMQQGQDNYRRETLFNQQIAETQRQEEQRRRTEAALGGGQAPSMAGPQPGTVTTPGSTQYAQAGGATPGGGNQIAQLVGEENFSRLQTIYQAFGPEAAQSTLESMLKPRDPLKLGEGEQLYDPVTLEPLASGPEKPPFSGAIRDESGNWVMDPDLQRAMLERSNAGRSTSTTTVNMGPSGIDYGDPEAGLAWARNPDGTVKLDERGAPIALAYQGGSVYQEQAATDAASAANDASRTTAAGIVVEDVERALKIINGNEAFTAGLTGDWMSRIPGSDAHNVSKLLDTVKANAGFDKLQAMRAASPTGGALGNVTERELTLLQGAIGNLEQSQSAGQLTYNMKRVANIYRDIIDGPGNGDRYDLSGGGANPGSPNPYLDKYGLTPRAQ